MEARFLIVEDDVRTQRSYARVIGTLGSTHAVATVAEAIACLGDPVWDGLLVDFLLGEGSRLHVLSHAHALAGSGSLPYRSALVVTGFPRPELPEAAAKFGAGFLTKSIGREQLRAFAYGGIAASFTLGDRRHEVATAACEYSLSPAETRVLALAVAGEARREWSERLCVSRHTVKSYIERIEQKARMRLGRLIGAVRDRAFERSQTSRPPAD